MAVASWTWCVSTGNLDLHLPPTQDFHERVEVLALATEGLVENCHETPIEGRAASASPRATGT